MRVALVSDWYLPRRGGIELHLADLAARLAGAGHLVDVVTTSPGADAVDAPAVPGVRVRRLAVPRLPLAGVAGTPALPRALRALVRAGGYDAVHCHASVVSPAAWAGAWAAREAGVPCVVTFHSVLHATARALAVADRLWGWAGWPLLATGVSARVTAQLRAAVPHARVAVLPNATDVGWWRAADDATVPGVPPRRPGEVRLVSAMRLARKKRPAALLPVIRAARGAAPAGVRVRLLVAGDGAEGPALAAATRRAGLGDAVTWLGWQPRRVLRALYRDADAFVLPTVHESFGIAALEARAAGLPVLGMAPTGLADFVTDGVDGRLCADDAGLAAAAAALVRDAALRRALGEASRARVPWAFDWGAVLARHEAAYCGEPLDLVPAGTSPAGAAQRWAAVAR